MPKRIGDAEHEIHAVRLFVEYTLAAGLRQNPLAERAAVVRDQRLHLGDRARVAVTVGGRDLGAAPLRRARVAARRPAGCGTCARRSNRVRHRRLSGAEPLGGGIRSPTRWKCRRVEADVKVGAERFRDLAAEEGAERLPGHTANDFADQIALRDRVIAALRAGLPPRRLRAPAASSSSPSRTRRRPRAGSSMPDRPAEWLMKWRTSTSALPFCANSGQ